MVRKGIDRQIDEKVGGMRARGGVERGRAVRG